MDILKELAELFKDFSADSVKSHAGVVALMVWFLFLAWKRKWVPILATIGASYLVLYVNNADFFKSETTMYFKVLAFGVIGTALFGIYLYYLWMASED